MGPGAVGGVLAASLQRAGLEVRLAGRRPADAARLVRSGISLTNQSGRVRQIRGLKSLAGRPREACSAVFICVKASDLAAALPAARAAASPDTPVISLLNGVGHERLLRREIGLHRLVFGSAYFAAMRLGPRAVRHAGGHLIWLAENPKNRRAARLATLLLRRSGWTVSIKRDETRLLWTKLMYNAGVNPIAALTRRSNGALASDPALKEITLRTLAEARLAAIASGHPPYPEMTPQGVLAGCRAVPDQMNSMIQDFTAGRRTEADVLLGPLVRAARRAKVPIPTLETLWAALRKLEADLA